MLLPHAHNAQRSFHSLSLLFLCTSSALAAPPLVGHHEHHHHHNPRLHGPVDYQVKLPLYPRQEQDIATQYGFFGGADPGQSDGAQTRLAPLAQVFNAMSHTPVAIQPTVAADTSTATLGATTNPTALIPTTIPAPNLGPGIVLLPSPVLSNLLSTPPSSVVSPPPGSSEAIFPSEGGQQHQPQSSSGSHNALILACVISGIIFVTVCLFFIMDPRISALCCGCCRRKQQQQKPQTPLISPPQNRSIVNAMMDSNNKQLTPSNASVMSDSPSSVPSAPSWKTHRVPPPRFIDDSGIYDTEKPGRSGGITATSTPALNPSSPNTNALHFLPSSKFSISTSGSRDSYASSTISSTSTGPPRLSTQGVKGMKIASSKGPSTMTNTGNALANHHDSLHINRRTLGAKLHGLIANAQNAGASPRSSAQGFPPPFTTTNGDNTHRASTQPAQAHPGFSSTSRNTLSLSLSAVPPPRRPPRPPTADSPALSDSVYLACAEQPYIIFTPGVSEGEELHVNGVEQDVYGFGDVSPPGYDDPNFGFNLNDGSPTTTVMMMQAGKRSVLLQQGRGPFLPSTNGKTKTEKILTPTEFAEMYKMGKVSSRVKRPLTNAGVSLGAAVGQMTTNGATATAMKDTAATTFVLQDSNTDHDLDHELAPRSPPGLGLLSANTSTMDSGLDSQPRPLVDSTLPHVPAPFPVSTFHTNDNRTSTSSSTDINPPPPFQAPPPLPSLPPLPPLPPLPSPTDAPTDTPTLTLTHEKRHSRTRSAPSSAIHAPGSKKRVTSTTPTPKVPRNTVTMSSAFASNFNFKKRMTHLGVGGGKVPAVPMPMPILRSLVMASAGIEPSSLGDIDEFDGNGSDAGAGGEAEGNDDALKTSRLSAKVGVGRKNALMGKRTMTMMHATATEDHSKANAEDREDKHRGEKEDEAEEEEEGSSFQNSNVAKRVTKHRRSRSASGWAYPSRAPRVSTGAV